jgi:hypothetical protein
VHKDCEDDFECTANKRPTETVITFRPKKQATEYCYITLTDGRQLYSKPNGWVSTDLPGSESNTDDARRLWKFKDGIISLKDG